MGQPIGVIEEELTFACECLDSNGEVLHALSLTILRKATSPGFKLENTYQAFLHYRLTSGADTEIACYGLDFDQDSMSSLEDALEYQHESWTTVFFNLDEEGNPTGIATEIAIPLSDPIHLRTFLLRALTILCAYLGEALDRHANYVPSDIQ